MEHAKTFAGIFDGLKLAYGTYRIDRAAPNGKQQGKAGVVKNPRTPETWEGHLSGKGDAIGIIPINEDNSCKWGCIDVDQYPLDHKELVERVRKMKLPMVVCRSKSGGAHCFLFTSEWITAKEMQDTLKPIAAALGYGGCEIFPKQEGILVERGDVGNFINLPYFDEKQTLRYAIKEDGEPASLEEFLDLVDARSVSPDGFVGLTFGKQVDENNKKLYNEDMTDTKPIVQTISIVELKK